MRVPERLLLLVEDGVIDEVVRPLLSGKEAQVWLVVARGVPCVAKVYKEAHQRSFRNRADYTEGRRSRNTRDQRALARKSRFGREQAEEAWRNAEVDAIHRLRAAGVRVPEPYDFVEGVLVMELVHDGHGNPAPRLVDVDLHRDEAEWLFDVLLGEVVRMLCAGVVHGDLSDFNVLLAPDGPVIIDFPQVSDPAVNQNARRLLIRDVDNLVRFFSRWLPEIRRLKFGEEMWDLYETGQLTPGTLLTGRWRPRRNADVSSLLREIEEIERETRQRREALGLGPPRPARAPVTFEEAPAGGAPDGRRKRRRRRGPRPAGAAAGHSTT